MSEHRDRAKDEERWEERFCPHCGGSHMARVRPAYQFYPSDEANETGLKLSSLAARGLWREMLNLMHEAVPRGWLATAAAKPIAPEQLARLVGESPATIRKLIAELEEHGVFSRTDTGIIYSRRMVRDEHISNVRAASGKKGGNPDLLSQSEEGCLSKRPDLVNHAAKQNGKQNPTPSSSTSSSTSSSASTAVAFPDTSTSDSERASGEDLTLARSQPLSLRAETAVDQLVATIRDPAQRRRTLADLRATRTDEGARFQGQRVFAVDDEHLAEICDAVRADPPDKSKAAGWFVLTKLKDSFELVLEERRTGLHREAAAAEEQRQREAEAVLAQRADEERRASEERERQERDAEKAAERERIITYRAEHPDECQSIEAELRRAHGPRVTPTVLAHLVDDQIRQRTTNHTGSIA